MSHKKVDTTTDQFLTILQSSNDDPQKLIKIIKAIEKTIPVKGRKRMPKLDSNLNKRFCIKRINYEITAKIVEFNKKINSYCIEVLSVDKGETKVSPGTFLFISKRELELTGRAIKQ